MSVIAKQVRHPYVTHKKGICGGSPIIKGTRTPVRSIVAYYKNVGYSPEEIVHHLPYLTLAQVHDALSYYYDHQEEIDEEIRISSDEEYWKKYVRLEHLSNWRQLPYTFGLRGISAEKKALVTTSSLTRGST